MFHLLLGRTGRLWPKVLDGVRAAKAAGRPCMVFAPEQSTLFCERALIEDLRLPGLLDLAVLSPSRLSFRVFEKAGRAQQAALDPEGRRILMAKALYAAEKELQYYRRVVEKPGFVTALASLLSAMLEAGVTPEDLTEAARSAEGGTALKWQDLGLILEHYLALLSQGYQDSAGRWQDMLERLPRSGLIHGADIIIYGFDMITPELHRLFLRFAEHAHSVTLLLVGDTERALGGRMFRPVLDGAEKLNAALDKAGIARTMTYLPPSPLPLPLPLRHLETHLLQQPAVPFEGAADSLRLYAAASPDDEVRRCVHHIRNLLQAGVSAEHITVLTMNAGYMSLFHEHMRRYNIPCHLSHRRALATVPHMLHVTSALQMLSRGFAQNDVLQNLYAGYHALTEEDGFVLANYIKAHRIRGGLLLSPFTRGSKEDAAQCEPLRQAFLAPILTLRDSVKNAADGQAAVTAMLAFLQQTAVPEKLQEEIEALKNAAMPEEALRVTQAWNGLMHVFDQLILLHPGERLPLSRLALIVGAAMEDMRATPIPPTTGAVQVGELGRMLPGTPQHLFILGMTDGALSAAGDALLPDDEKELFCQSRQIYIGIPVTDKEKIRTLDAWKAMAACQNTLWLSYPLKQEDGTALRPLPLLRHIRRLFPALKEEGGMEGEDSGLPLAQEPLIARLAQKWGAGQPLTEEETEGLAYLLNEPACHDRVRRLLELSRAPRTAPRLNAATAKQLYPQGVMSISQLEQFAACPYQYFVTYGLRPRENKEWQVDARDRGSLYHDALEHFVLSVKALPGLGSLSWEDALPLAQSAFDGLLTRYDELAIQGSGRAEQQFRHLKTTYLSACRAVLERLQNTAYQVRHVEAVFGKAGGLAPLPLPLPSGGKVLLSGKIDRVDTLEGPPLMLRIVDYKSGHNRPDAAKIKAGLQMQLLLYFEALKSTYPNARPCALLYQPLQAAMQEVTAAPDEQQARDSLHKALQMHGLILRDAEAVAALDTARPPLSLPNLIKKDGELSQKDWLLEEDDINTLAQYTKTLAGVLAEHILSGDITPCPTFIKTDGPPCTLCAFALLCKKDPYYSPLEGRQLLPLQFTALLREIKETENDERRRPQRSGRSSAASGA